MKIHSPDCALMKKLNEETENKKEDEQFAHIFGKCMNPKCDYHVCPDEGNVSGHCCLVCSKSGSHSALVHDGTCRGIVHETIFCGLCKKEWGMKEYWTFAPTDGTKGKPLRSACSVCRVKKKFVLIVWMHARNANILRQ